MDIDDRATIAEKLLLLQQFGYRELHSTYRGAIPISRTQKSPNKDINLEMRLLDTFAVALCTGKPGEVYAAAFDKRIRVQLVIAKNGLPTPEDKEAAKELVSLLADPSVTDQYDLFPFLHRRCLLNINKRIGTLNKSSRDTRIRDLFEQKLPSYTPTTPLGVELQFNNILQKLYGGVDTNRPFTSVWIDLLDKLAELTAPGLDTQDVKLADKQFADIIIFTTVISKSHFLKHVIAIPTLSDRDREMVAKFKRHCDKVQQYYAGITDLIKKAKRFLPFDVCWATDQPNGSGEGVFTLPSRDPYVTIGNYFEEHPIPRDILSQLNDKFPKLRQDWERQRTIHATVHAELRIILALGPPSSSEPVRPIGVSKRSCLACALWIHEHNGIFETQWMTSGSHGKPYANWAPPGLVHPYLKGRLSVDRAVLNGISKRLDHIFAKLFPNHRRRSDEYVSSSSEESSPESTAIFLDSVENHPKRL